MLRLENEGISKFGYCIYYLCVDSNHGNNRIIMDNFKNINDGVLAMGIESIGYVACVYLALKRWLKHPCRHPNWARYYGSNKMVCVDCKLEKPLELTAPRHQR